MKIDLPSYGPPSLKQKFKIGSRSRPFILYYSGTQKTREPIKYTISSEEIPFHLLRKDARDLLFVDVESRIIPYWIENISEDKIDVWLKFPKVAKSFVPFWVYYGNKVNHRISHISAAFKYRRKITITEQSGSDLIDYQVLIELNNSNFNFEHAQTNGEDIRFTDANGNLLDYWIEEWDAVNEKAKVWVKVPSIPINGTIEIYCYYGNKEITDASDVVATFIRVIDGLVASWHFDEGSGTTAYDSSGNNNHGTLVNGPQWVDGKYGKALSFDGSDDYVDCGTDESLNITDAITIEAWVNFSSWETGVRMLYSRGEHFANKRGVFLGIRATTGLDFWLGNGTEGSSLVSEGGVPTNQFSHVVGVWDGTTRGIYINGTLNVTDSFSGPIDYNTSHAVIGTRSAGGAYFPGIIDEVRIYNRALSADEISDIYNNYGYTTTNYPGKVLVRKYTEPEPSASIGAEETA